jgi:1-acyl-sn-glycerol-3-phosphate acyltransferase
MGLISEAKLLSRGRDWRGRSRTPRSAEPWAKKHEPKEFPTAWARTPVTGIVRTAIQRGVLKPVAWSQTRVTVEGREYLDGLRGPAIFIANHSSHLDTPMILGSLPRRFTDRLAVGAAADYFFDARWRAFTTALVFNTFPVERYGSRRLRGLAGRLVDDAWSLLLFPEGTRSQDGWMNPFKVGAAALCISKGIPCVPISLRGTYGAMPRGRNWPRPGRPKVVIRYGRPMRAEAGEGVRDFSFRMMSEVTRLWNEEELGWYEALRASAAGQLSAPTGPKAITAEATPAIEAGSDVDTAPAAGTDVVPAEPEDASRWRRIWESTRPLDDERPRPVWPGH